MKRIAFFQSELETGGIQKSIINLLRNLDYSRVQADLYLSVPGAAQGIAFPKELGIKTLKPVPRAYSFMPFGLAFRLADFRFPDTAEYDLAVDFNSYQFSCAAGALAVPAKRRVMWIHNDVEIKLRNEWKYRVLWHFFKGKFARYDGFAGVSEGVIGPFQRASGVAGKPFRVIQNYIDTEEIRLKSREEPEDLALDEGCVNFVAVGRLCHQKGYDLMLELFRRACAERDDLRLYIIGDGPDREALERQAAEAGLGGKVFFLGAKGNPFCYMARMDAFISTSRYEGQGMNIAEAMVIGLPVYCPKRLERYMGGFTGYEEEELLKAVAAARKEEKHPADLSRYNSRILTSIEELADPEKPFE